jgi:hypothetical protein
MRDLLAHGYCTFENDTDNPSLLFGSSAVIYTLHDFRLYVAGSSKWDGWQGRHAQTLHTF